MVEWFVACHHGVKKKSETCFLAYYSVWTCYWVMTSKQTTKQNLLLGNRSLISKYTQLSLSNAFANKHFSTIGARVQRDRCKRVCDEKT
jgi:hypothetical protein